MVRSHHLWFWLLLLLSDVAGVEGGGLFCNVGIVLTAGAMLGVLQCGYCADWGCNVGCSAMWVLC